MSVFSHALSTNNYGEAKFIVDSSPANGTHTTIAAALTSASSGDTIFIRPGTYTENLTLKAGVNLCAFGPSIPVFSSATVPNVIINGTCTFTAAGTVGISGIALQTNAAFALAVTGSAASIVKLDKCFLHCVDNTGVSFTSSSASSEIDFSYCNGDLGTTGIALFAHSAAGRLRFLYSFFANTGVSTTNNTVSNVGSFFPNYSSWANGLTLSNSSTMNGSYLDMTMVSNQTGLTTSSSATVTIVHGTFTSGTSSAISVGAGTAVVLHYCLISSSNATSIAGTGTLSFTNLTFNSVASLAAGLTLSNGAMNSFISGAGVGTTGQVLVSNGVSSPPTWQASSSGVIVQQIRQRLTTKTQYTSIPAIPRDTTIPQNTEGTEMVSQAITPTSATNILWIQLNITGAVDNTTNNNVEIALFQDSTANALETQAYDLRATAVEGCTYFYFSHFMVAGTTSATTFKFRLGGQNLGTITVNGAANSALYGGTMGTILTITELTP